MAIAHRDIGRAQYFIGAICGSAYEYRACLGGRTTWIAGSCEHRRPGILCVVLSVILALQGYPDQAAQWSEEALRRARALGQQPILALALMTAGTIFHDVRREREAALAYADELVALATEKGWTNYRVWGEIDRGLGRVEQGQAKAGIAQMQQGIADWRAMQNVVLRPRQMLQMADAFSRAGMLAQRLAAAMKHSLWWKEFACAPLSRGLASQGGAAGSHGGASGAAVEACLCQAIEVAASKAPACWS